MSQIVAPGNAAGKYFVFSVVQEISAYGYSNCCKCRFLDIPIAVISDGNRRDKSNKGSHDFSSSETDRKFSGYTGYGKTLVRV